MARLRQFFDDYAAALGQATHSQAASSKAAIEDIASAYAEQFMATGPGLRMSMNNDEHFRAGLAQAAQLYRRLGVDVVEVKNYLEAELGEGFWLTKVEWELLDEDLNTIVTFDNTYMVETDGSAPKILLFISHNEHERMQDMGLLDSDRQK
jgi:hypothetical protein